MKRSYVAAAVLASGAALMIGTAAPSGPAETRTTTIVDAAWKETYLTPGAMARGVDTIVVARAVETSAGRVYRGPNRDALPFQEVRFVVERAYKGASVGRVVIVERAGGTVDGRTVRFAADGGSYERGRRYLLFLNAQPTTGMFYLVNDQGRYLIDDTLVPAGHGRVARALGGKSLERIESLLTSHLER